MADVGAVDQDMRSAGAWVFTAGLHPPGTVTVVRAEGKEHIGGFWIIRAADLDEALGWARRATNACQLPIEVRPMVDPAGD